MRGTPPAVTPQRPGESPARRRPGTGRGRWPARDYPTLLWLLLAAAAALVHPWLPESGWLMVHLVLLGALTHAILVWSTYFSQALLKTAQLEPRGRQSARLWLVVAGSGCVLVGVPWGWWPLVVTGALAVTTAVGWHGVAMWRRLRRALPGRFRISIRYYLLAAACLPVGVTFGVLLARGLDDEWHGRLLVAHTMTMVLGWIGLTVTGTLVTLWPTMLRTRMDDRAERLAIQALPVLVGAVVVVIAGAVTGERPIVVAGLVGYLAGVAWWGRALVAPARRRPPREFATGSVACALVWLPVALGWVLVLVATSPWPEVADGYGSAAAVIVGGFAVQLLFGALSYLIPVVFGGGPRVVRAVHQHLDRGATWRLVLTNAGVLALIAPVPSLVRVLVTLLGFVALITFVVLLISGFVVGVRARRAEGAGQPREQAGQPRTARIRTGWKAGQFVAALGAIVVAVAVGTAVGGGGRGTPRPSTAVEATGETTEVTVTADAMRFHPATIAVPRGNRLVVTLVNQDATTVHDLLLENGARSARLRPGQSDTVDVGVVGASLTGWCTLVGHRQQGMTLAIEVEGADPATASGPGQPGAGHHSSAGAASAHPVIDGDFSADFDAYDPVLPPLSGRTIHQVTWRIRDVEMEVAPGVWQRRWTYDGRSPGPTLHGRIGDRFEVTIVNDGTMGHSMDFHASQIAPDEVMRTIPPGESLTYSFTADRAGAWLYHCSSTPMSAHLAAGMVGAVVIEPDGLPPVDRSYLLVQSELYLGASTEKGKASEVDAERIPTGIPDGVVFNGAAFQYRHEPLAARVGDRVRIWVVAAGPDRPTSFHVVGAQFDTVYAEGAYLLTPATPGGGGSQTLALGAAQGGFVELSFAGPGHYPVVSHVMSDAERGASGIIRVTG